MPAVQVPGCVADIHRNSATADLMLGRYVVIIGGITGDVIADTVLVYDVVLKVWSEFQVPGTPKVYGHATCVVNRSTLYLHGGCCGNAYNLTDEFYKLKMSFKGTQESRITNDEQTLAGVTNLCNFSMTWVALLANQVLYRHSHTLTYDPDTRSLYMFGGLDRHDQYWGMTSWDETEAGSRYWKAVVPNGALPQIGANHSMTYVGQNRLLLIVEVTKHNSRSVDVWIFSTKYQVWKEVHMTGLKPTSLSTTHTTTFVSDAFIFVLGGAGKNTEKICLNLTNKTWSTLPNLGQPMQPISRFGHRAIHVDDSIFIFGGCGMLPWQKNVLELDIKLLALTRRLPQLEFSADFTPSVGSAKFSDAEIVLDDNTRIHVHSLLLGTRCDYFAKLTEFQGTEVSHREIRMSGIERSTMLQVLTYIYNGVLPQTQDFQGCISLYKLADRLGIQLLTDHATVPLVENIKFENLVLLLNLGNETNSNQIINVCAEYLKNNREEAVKHDILKQLDPAVLLSVAKSWLTTQ